MLDSETRRRIDTARDILVGKVPDPKSQVEQITIALIYKFMDDMDAESEEMGGKRSFFAGEFEKYGWSKLMAPNMGGYDVINLYSEAIQRFDFNPGIPQLFRDIFKNAYLPYRDPETLKSFLKIINDFEYDHSEKLGDAFEYLLSILGSQGEAGQFRTPRHIIDFMVAAIDPKKNDVIIDPACGTAGFLISSYKHIVKQNSSNYDPEKDTLIADAKDISELIPGSNGRYKGDKLTPDERTRLANNIKGYDISPDMVRLSLVNMYLHGFTDPHIDEYDTLTNEDRWNEFGDVIMANPPFMSPKGGIKPHKRFSVQSKRSEVLFVDYIAEHLTPNGRAAVIVPEGIIFQSGTAYKALRKMLVENYLFCVVSLPSGVFNPYSGVKTSILLMDKMMAKKTNKILFVKIENDGFDLGAQRRRIQGSDLPEAFNHIKTYIQTVRTRQDFNTAGIKNLLLVTKQQLGENSDFNLSLERYKTEETRQTKWPMVEIGKVCTVASGFGFPLEKQGYTNKEYPFLKVSDMNLPSNDVYIKVWNNTISNTDLLELQAKVFPPSTIIFPKIGAAIATNKKRILTIPSTFDNNVMGLVHGSDILPLYLFYIIKSIDISIWASESSPPSMRKTVVEQYKIPLPPLNIQQEIVTEIETYQKIIDGARQVVENYKPVIKIDPEWPMLELGDVITLEYGKPLKDENRVKGPYPVYGSNGVVGWHNEFIVQGPFIVVGRKGTAGAITYSELNGFPIDTTFYVSIKNSDTLDLKFLYYQLLHLNLDKVNVQSGVPGLNRNDAYKKRIAVPPLDVQTLIVTQIEKEQELINANKELIQIYEQKIKDTIAGVWET